MHPYVIRREVIAQRPLEVLPTRDTEPEMLRPFCDRDLRGEVRREFIEADRRGRAR